MTYVIDTHVIIWFLEGNSRLPDTIAAQLRSAHDTIVIPSIVLAECWHYFQRKSASVSISHLRSQVLQSTNAVIQPLDVAVLDLLPRGFEIHDSIIIASALFQRDVLKKSVGLVSADARIQTSGLIDVIW